ncbi:MAG: serine/threonine-protein kinase, partial [Pirellulaceae bacterium]
MNRDQQINELFLAACDMPVDQRSEYLDEACQGDSQLRDDVESLLDHDDPSSLIESGPTNITSEHRSDQQSSQRQQALPDRVGRYRFERELGRGGYGVVCLAHDEQLNRLVAIKIPHARLVATKGHAEDYLTEARTVAGLDHPHIVPVYDVGSTDEVPCYVVSKYIEGTDLATRRKSDPPSLLESVQLVATVAEALHYAHLQGLVHRDIKPGNILIDTDGQPHIVDFGLALKEENIGKGPRFAGTPAYMSPEQARGEGHRVDGRSDIFSLGAVLYELLTRRQPFSGDTPSELAEQITSWDVRPIRQIDDRVPAELERICLKALAKRSVERYSTARDFAGELRMFLADYEGHSAGSTDANTLSESNSSRVSGFTPTDTSTADSSSESASRSGFSSGKPPIRIVPRGLRSFDEHDADFFLELLPGPRDRTGL